MNEMQIIKEALQDNDKILKFLIDRAQNIYAQYQQTFDCQNSCRVEPDAALQAISAAAGRTWEVMRDAYTNGPGFVYADAKKQRELRQALRLLNFASRVVSHLLQASSHEFVHHSGQNYWRARAAAAERASELAESMARLVSPGPKSYDHPQYQKWHELTARAKRRVAAIWLQAAVADENRAKQPLAERS